MNIWPQVPIGECARIVGGSTPRSETAEYWDGDIPWTTPKDLSDLQGKYLADTPRKITEAGLKSCSSELLPANSVLFSSRAPIGHVAINLVPMATNQGFKSFIPGPKLDASFLFWWLKANRPKLELLGNGATFKEVSKAVVERIEIPLPPLEEQKRIAAILDQADELRRKRRQALDRLNQLGQAIFVEMFGDISKLPRTDSFDEVATIQQSLVDPKLPQYQSALHVGPEHLTSGVGFVDWKLVRTAHEDSVISGKNRFECGDILYSKIRPYLNKVAIADRSGICSADMYVIQPIEQKSTAQFLKALLMNNDFLAYAETCSNRANIPKLNRNQVERYRFHCPPIDAQRDFADRLSDLVVVTSLYTKAAEQTEALFSSLQHRAFRGELTVSSLKEATA